MSERHGRQNEPRGRGSGEKKTAEISSVTLIWRSRITEVRGGAMWTLARAKQFKKKIKGLNGRPSP